MKKVLLILALSLSMLLAGCDKSVSELLPNTSTPAPTSSSGSNQPSEPGVLDADGHEQLSADRTYYNDYLGLTMTLPAGYWVYEVNSENLSTAQGLTSKRDLLALNQFDGGEALTFINYANLKDDSRQSHLDYYLIAERYDDYTTFDDFYEMNLDYYLEPTEDAEYELVEERKIEANGVEGTLAVLHVTASEGYSYGNAFATLPLANGFFLTIEVSFYEENTAAIDNIVTHISEVFSINTAQTV